MSSLASLLSGGSAPEHVLYYSGFDLWWNGGSSYGGLLWSPKGLDRDGFILKLLAGEGRYGYLAGTTTIHGTYFLGSVMPGWRATFGHAEVKVFGGLDVQYHLLSPIDPANKLRGTHAGARIGTDIWWQPDPRVMVSGSLSASTIGMGWGLHGAIGWRLFDSFYAGPEIDSSGDSSYRQYRVGAHITALRTGAFEWSFGAGYVHDNSQRSGAYGRMSLLTRQ